MADRGSKPRFTETTRQRAVPPNLDEPAEPVVVLAYHPTLARVGEWAPLRSRVTEVSRLAPSLHGLDGCATGPIDDPFVSRQPIELTRLPGNAGVEIVNPHGIELVVEGSAVAPGAARRCTTEELGRGVQVVLGDRVVLWLTTDHGLDGDDVELFGRCAAMRALRAEVADAAATGRTVLVVGETGTGKELVARALHAAGPRAAGPFVAVNVAAIPAAVAAAELFGHERGAFTGAGERRAGYFERAAGGVLFLDEVGELSESIQPMILRALQANEIQPVGGTPHTVDVVVVAATDADLERAAAAGRFRAPLYYRLAATTIRVPPLRERGVDVPMLLARFLAAALPAELADQATEARPWLAASVVAELARRVWPGNVRQLEHAALRLAAIARAGRTAALSDLGPSAALDDGDDALAPEDDPAPPASGPIDDDRLVAALREHQFQLNRTAEALGISRTHLDALIARSSRVRKAKDLDRDEIVAAVGAGGNDLDAAAAALEVSPRGLRLRMRQLGL